MDSIGIQQRGVRERIVNHILKIQRRGGVGMFNHVKQVIYSLPDSDVQFWETTMFHYTDEERQLSELGNFILSRGHELLTGEEAEGETTGVVTLKNESSQGIGHSHFKLSFSFQLKQQKVST
jgi:hypothetical protein